MAKAMITEAEFFRNAFESRDTAWVRSVMEQFSIEPRHNVGASGWLWKLSDGTSLIQSDGMLIAAPNLRCVR